MKHLSMTLMAALLAVPVTILPAAGQDNGESMVLRGPGPDDLGATSEGFLMEDGAGLYAAVCSGCHQPQGEGAVGAATYPPLAANPRLQGGQYPAWIIINGMGAMPAFDEWLSDDQIVAVVTYIQQNFANDFTDHPTAEMVSDIRQTAEEDAPETAGEQERNE